jgi:hypothetical protein
MSRPSILSFIVWLLGTMLFIGGADAANMGLTQAATEEQPDSTTTLNLHYDYGLINAHIDSAPLGKILHELVLKTGMQVNLSDPVIASWPVSVTLKAIPLEQGVQMILDGFSYVIYRISNVPAVIVLSTQPNSTQTRLKSAVIGVKHALLPPVPDKTMDIFEDPDPVIHRSGEGVPQSLDELQPITVEEAFSDSEAAGDDAADPSARLAQEQEYNEALLQRALNALKSEHKHLHVEAIDQLADLEDPRATESIVQAVSSGAGLDPKSRLQAVGALRRHAENLHFADATSVNALKQLAEDSDENIRSLARQALQHMEHYQNIAQ